MTVPDSCELCRDSAAVGVVVALGPDARSAIVALPAGELPVAIDLVPDVRPGEPVLVQRGFALGRLPPP